MNQQVMAQVQQMAAQQTIQQLGAMEKKLDEELNKDIETIRRNRIEQLKAKQKKVAEWKQKGHLEFDELADQQAWFNEAKTNERFVCCFGRATADVTKVVNMHLKSIARKHIETRFCYIDAEKAPYLAEKLSIVLLPTIMLMKDNTTAGRIEGLDPLGGRVDFKEKVLRSLLGKQGMIEYDGEVQERLRNAKEMKTSSNPDGKAIYQSKRSQFIAEMGSDSDPDELSD